MRFKFGICLLIAVLAFVFITQNTETVQVKVFLWSIEMSLVLLVFIILAAGVMIGWLMNSYMRFAAQRKQARAQANLPTAKQTADSRPAANDRSGRKGDPAP